MQQKKFGSFFLRNKADFLAFFRHFKASVGSRPPGPPAVPGVLSLLVFSFNFVKEYLTLQSLGFWEGIFPCGDREEGILPSAQ